ncbi:MAG: HlyD family efflux transporter periplasmic adaptor subunit [Acidimicrobiales bacterium]|nr:HlyD family efflux transporter periplasmic adaptor subunit [Acidimicrobiales bacterium]
MPSNDPVPGPTPAHRSTRFSTQAKGPARWRRLAAGGLAVVVVGSGVAVATRGSSAPAGYRTATAATREVDQVLDGVATIEPVSQASVAFPVAGTVSAVRVQVGDTVSTGQSLATLDTQSLKDALDTKQAALDQAELILEKALNGEDVSALVRSSGGSGAGSAPSGASTLQSSASATSTTPTSLATSSSLASTSGVGGIVRPIADTADTAGTPTTMAPAAPSPTAAELRAAAQKVLDAQKQVDADLATAQAALESADQVCAAIDTSTTTTTAPADPTTSTTSGDTTTTTTATTPSDTIDACTTALAAVQDAQRAVAASEQAVSDASATYADLLSRAASGVGTGTGTGSGPGSSSPGGTGNGTGSSNTGSGAGRGSTSSPGSTGSPSGAGAGTATKSPSAEDLVSYQKAVDAATSEVAVAQQALAQATIVTPISGTVAKVDLAVGDDVTAASDTATVVVVGTGGYEVSTTVGVAKVPKVKVGQAATVVPDGSETAVTGKVVSIGVAGTTSGSTTTYPVVIGLTGDTSSLGNGATASVEIVTDASTNALAVPTSAVTTTGTRHTVEVLSGTKTEQVSVQVGAVGRVWTEIKSGLTAGQRVVLADLSLPLPGSATSSSNGTATNGTRQGGGGARAFPGGFPGGGGGARPGG